MIIEGIRNLLGEDLAKQVEAALKGKGKDGKDVDLVIGFRRPSRSVFRLPSSLTSILSMSRRPMMSEGS